MRSRSFIFAILCLLAACSAKDDGNASTAATPHHQAKLVPASTSTPASDDRNRMIFTPVVRTGTWYRAGAYRVRSLMPRVEIAPAPDLPVIPYAKTEDAHCPSIAQPQTPEGRWPLARGWRIGEEEALGKLTIVNVLRNFEYGPKGDCQPIDGRFLLFNKGKPIATIVTRSVDVYQFGVLEKTERGALRLTTSLLEAPYGDLFVKGRDIEIAPLPPRETVCGGGKTMPNVFGQPILRARVILRRAGWKPATAHRVLPVSDENGMGGVWSGEDYMYHDGVTEVMSCEPRGECDMGYRSGRATARVITQGGEVSSYEVDCEGKHLKVGGAEP